MKETFQRAGVAASLAILLSACEGGPSRLTGPPLPAPAPAVTYTLSGTITEETIEGPVGVDDVIVSVSGASVRTDASGSYAISGVVARNSVSVFVNKAGYVSGSRVVSISGDTRLDIQITRVKTFTLFGVVFEMTPGGRLPIRGVSVYCDSCGSPSGHTFAETDMDGSYSFAWTNNGLTPLIVSKEGYRLPREVPPGPIAGWIVANVNGDTRFDIELVRH